MSDPTKALLLMIAAGALLAAAAGLVAGIIYRRVRHGPLLPAQQPWSVPWKGPELAIVFAAWFIILPYLLHLLLNGLGFFQQLYGPDFPQASNPTNNADPHVAEAAHLRGLWCQMLAAPIQLLLTVLGFKGLSGATLLQMGIGTKRIGQNYLLGYLGWLLLTPASFAVFAIAIMFTPNPQKHPLMELGPWAGDRERVLFIVQAALMAPIVEELLFRGLLLPWSVTPPDKDTTDHDALIPPEQRPLVSIALALLAALMFGGLVAEASSAGPFHLSLQAFAPVSFVLLLTPPCMLVSLSPRVQRWSGIQSPHAVRGWFATSLLFAAIHSSVWPSPVPLFVLALGLGWLAIRTRSIIPSIVTHMLFNGVAVVYQLMGGAE